MKVTVVLPAYNAEKTLERTINDIPREIVDDVILVDDKSEDNTVELAKKLGLHDIQHKTNQGYGGNQKTCYKSALERGADIIIMIHPDHQYDPKLIKHLVNFIQEGYFDVMLGTRIRSRRETLQSGMPLYKYISNRLLTIFQNLITGQNFSEWHTGMRAYTKEVLIKIDFKQFSDDFVFDTQALFKIVENNFKVGEIPVPVRYFSEASSINFKRSLKYGIQTVGVSVGYLFRKIL